MCPCREISHQQVCLNEIADREQSFNCVSVVIAFKALAACAAQQFSQCASQSASGGWLQQVVTFDLANSSSCANEDWPRFCWKHSCHATGPAKQVQLALLVAPIT
jgi:hypothetical protein